MVESVAGTSCLTGINARTHDMPGRYQICPRRIPEGKDCEYLGAEKENIADGHCALRRSMMLDVHAQFDISRGSLTPLTGQFFVLHPPLRGR